LDAVVGVFAVGSDKFVAAEAAAGAGWDGVVVVGVGEDHVDGGVEFETDMPGQ